ncbi:MAG: C13 family peptidase [Chloroflexota bacterium]
MLFTNPFRRWIPWAVISIAIGGVLAASMSLQETVPALGLTASVSTDEKYVANAQPTADLIPLDEIAHVAAGRYHTCVRTTTGGVKCWGANNVGQLGDGTTTQRHLPTDVQNLGSQVVTVVAGGSHSCALTTDNTLFCWGANTVGQLGADVGSSTSVPVEVADLNSVITAISTHRDHTCVLTEEGGVKCWGQNSLGQLGNGSTEVSQTPVDVSGLTSGVTAMSVSNYHSCAAMAAGGVKCWGRNQSGQLGSGATSDHIPTPVDVNGLAERVSALALGDGHSCALIDSDGDGQGGVKCWGANNYGQLGNGTRPPNLSPVDVSGLTDGVAAITAGQWFTCALTATGGVKCWGYNVSSQLGDETSVNRNTPVDVSGLDGGVIGISAGDDHVCATLDTGHVNCWGENQDSQLGDGALPYHNTPLAVTNLPSTMTAVATGDSHTCAIATGGGVYCWGWNSIGKLGDGSTVNSSVPVAVNSLGSGADTVLVGTSHSCVLTIAGGVQCWGGNDDGQVGNGTVKNQQTPVDVSKLPSDITQIALGREHTCALSSSSGVFCWGLNSDGQLGDGTNDDRHDATALPRLSDRVMSIAAGAQHSCVITTEDQAQCWGSNDHGQLGDGTKTSRSTPVTVPDLNNVTALALGFAHTCALTDAGKVQCWGRNTYGQLGDGTQIGKEVPVDAQGLNSGVTAITAGDNHTCALSSDGSVRCWGINSYGEVGDGTDVEKRHAPVAVSELSGGIVAIAGGLAHTCAITEDGGLTCWGRDQYGQLGSGRLLQSAVPINVMTTPCYPLTLSHQGDGQTPSLFPANSDACGAGHYTAGDTITLLALPTSGWLVSGWNGTDDDSSMDTSNTVTMPANDHTVTVTYSQTTINTATAIPTATSAATPAVTPGVTPTGMATPMPPEAGDIFETNNLCQDAGAITPDGTTQTHTFHQADDVDWVYFEGEQGTTYRIEIQPGVGSTVDVALELYAICSALADQQQSKPFTPGVRLDFAVPTSGPYYLKIENTNSAAGGPDTDYELAVKPLATEPDVGAAIILAGRLHTTDALQQNIHNVTDAVFDLFQAHGYSAEDIYYLSTDLSSNLVDASATTNNLRSAIVDWAKNRLQPNQALTLYLMDHGERDLLFVDEVNQERVTPEQLDEWLSEVELAVPGTKVNVIIEACYAGTFIEGAETIAKPNRVVIASSSPEWSAYASRNGAHFSDHFLTSLQQGGDLFKSFWWAKRVVNRFYPNQEPWIDANGNGIPNEIDDAAIAAERGFAYTSTFDGQGEQWPPYIVSAVPPTINDTSGTIQAEVRDNEAVESVWAVIYPPSYQEPPNDRELVAETLDPLLLRPQGDGQYAVNYSGFTEAGIYRIVIHAEDVDGLEGAPVVLEVEHGQVIYVPFIVD